MRLLADMGVDVRVVDWLRSQGHDATHLRDEGLQRLPNGEILALSKGRKAGVILFRLRNTRTPHVIQRLSSVLSDCVEPLERGGIVIVQESRRRVREFPG